MNGKVWIIGLAALVVIGQEAIARQQGDPRGRRRPGIQEEEELRDTMTLLMTLRMKRELELSKDQEKEILPLLEGLVQARWEAREESRGTLMHLRALIDDPESDEAGIADLLNDVRSIRQNAEERQKSLRQEIDRHLDIRQQAKMIFFEDRFRREMERRARRIREFQEWDGPEGDRRPRRR